MGVLLAFGTGLSFSVMNLCIRKGGRVHPGEDGVLSTLVVNIVAFSLLWIVASATGGLREVRADAALVFVSIGLTGAYLGRTFLFAGINQVGLVRASAIKNASPIVTLLMAVILLGERFTLLGSAGIVLILAGVFVVVRESLLGARVPSATIGSGGADRGGSGSRPGPASGSGSGSGVGSGSGSGVGSGSGSGASLSPGLMSTAEQDRHHVVGVALAMLAAIAFGASNALSKVGLNIVPDVIQAGAFGAWAALVAYILTAAVRGQLHAVAPGLAARRPWFWLAGLAGTAGQLTFFGALHFIEVGPATVVAASEVILTTALGGLLAQRLELVTRRLAIPAIMVFAGAALIAISR